MQVVEAMASEEGICDSGPVVIYVYEAPYGLNMHRPSLDTKDVIASS